jgi:hypothetical protein
MELATCIPYIRTRIKGIVAEARYQRLVSLTVSYKWESNFILHCMFLLGTWPLWLIENNKSKMYLNDSSSRVLRIIKTSTNNYNHRSLLSFIANAPVYNSSKYSSVRKMQVHVGCNTCVIR